jgi:hypothetical protein
MEMRGAVVAAAVVVAAAAAVAAVAVAVAVAVLLVAVAETETGSHLQAVAGRSQYIDYRWHRCRLLADLR